jgi:hypothetical protein
MNFEIWVVWALLTAVAVISYEVAQGETKWAYSKE